ncbi:MAG: MBL fold metallo-hydrolase [Deltaproteobacteria bacterium]|nr:MBL fold metallo-hydrolase [Deltaproteobacteria bacterium]
MGNVDLKPVDMVEIVTLTDNFVDLTSMDNSEVLFRAAPLRGNEFSNSILAEHGFSALVRMTDSGITDSMILDFGLSEDAAARNAEALNLDLSQVAAAALSHGHIDHFGGMAKVGAMVGKTVPLAVHPAAFQERRWMEPFPEFEILMPVITREEAARAGFTPIESAKPLPMLDGRVLFLGEIERTTDFEKGMPNAFRTENGQKVPDPLEDDTSLVMHLKGKGLVVLSGCAHSGIVNTVRYAQKVTGVNEVFAVMGGFHLGGPAFATAIPPTVAAIKDIGPRYVIPTHCTGRDAQSVFKREMPGAFLLNMAGTTLRFAV